MDTLFQDIRYALRSLRKSPGFALVAVLTIGLAVGANTVAFTWLERFVLEPLPAVPESDRLVAVATTAPGGNHLAVSYANLRDWREGVQSIDGPIAESFEEMTLRTTGPGERTWGAYATADYFDVLRVRPALGRAFLPDEEARATPVAVISHALWQRTFAGDSGVVGRHVMLNGHDVVIVGVAPARFGGTISILRFDLWVPITLYEVLRPRPGEIAPRTAYRFNGFARLRPGVTIAQARQDLNAVHRRIVEADPGIRNTTVDVSRLSEFGPTPMFLPVIGALLGVTVVVLLVACANLANLLLARAGWRQREIGIRLAVGASRARLVRQLLTESLVLAVSGGAVGILIAKWSKGAMTALLPAAPFPIFVEYDLDARVLGLALAVSVLTGMVFGLAPALQASRVSVAPALRGGAATGSAGRGRMQSALVASQVAMSLVCLVCAGLFVRGLQHARTFDTGMHAPRQVLVARTNFFLAGYTDSTGPAALDRVLERARALPGVRSVSVASRMPLALGGWPNAAIGIEGYTFGNDETNGVPFSNVGPEYFETIGVPILRGRGFTAEDRATSLPVAVVNEAFAQRYWAGLDPLGRHITVDGLERTVVGVSRNSAFDHLGAPTPPILFQPVLQAWWPGVALLVRTSGDPRTLGQTLRRTIEAVDPALPFTDVRTLAEHIDANGFAQRIGAWVMTACGTLALVLAAVGLFGLLSYSVAQRTREIGVRIAVGASRRDVMALVVGKAVRLAAIGLGVGLVLAAGAGRLLRSQIFGVSPLDPVTFVGVTLLLAAVALLAAWLPARRAARVDPVIALQAE